MLITNELAETITAETGKDIEVSLNDSLKTYARFAGLFYLLIAIAGGFSIGYVPSVIIEPGDASTTAQNIAENLGLFQIGIAADIFVLMLEVVLTVMLYRLFKPVNRTLSLIAAFCRLAMSVVMALNLLNYLIPLLLLSGAVYLNVFDPDQLHALALLFLDTHQYGVYIWGLFFSCHLMALGYLVLKSGYFPRVIGVLMMVGSIGYALESIAAISHVDNALVSAAVITFLVVAVVGELSFAFWLLIKTVNVSEWHARISISREAGTYQLKQIA
jgi:hypothetical protein